MNSLEFIDKQIDFFKRNIEFYENLLKRRINPLLPREPIDDKLDILPINEIEIKLKGENDFLKHCQQIKSELEAWYSVKSGLMYKYRMSEEIRCAYTIYLTDDEMESIQKALEVKDDK